MAIGDSAVGGRLKRPFGVRLYLTIGFAAVALIAAGLSYLLLTGSSDSAASQRAADITVGRAVSLADRIGRHPAGQSQQHFDSIADPGFSAWVYGRNRTLLTSKRSRGFALHDVESHPEDVTAALQGERTVDRLPDGVTVVATPVFRNGMLSGALVVRADQPQALSRTIAGLGGDRLKAALVAVAIAIVMGFLIATAITVRVKRLASSAARMTEGKLDEPLQGTGGRDDAPATWGSAIRSRCPT